MKSGIHNLAIKVLDAKRHKYLFKRMFVKSFRAAALVNILKPHCQNCKQLNSNKSTMLQFLGGIRRPGIERFNSVYGPQNHLRITDSRTSSQKNHDMETLHQEVAVPLSLKHNLNSFYLLRNHEIEFR